MSVDVIRPVASRRLAHENHIVKLAVKTRRPYRSLICGIKWRVRLCIDTPAELRLIALKAPPPCVLWQVLERQVQTRDVCVALFGVEKGQPRALSAMRGGPETIGGLRHQRRVE